MPLPLMTSAWTILPSLRAANVTEVPALIVTVSGVIRNSLSDSVIVPPDPDNASDASAGDPEPAVGAEAGPQAARTTPNPVSARPSRTRRAATPEMATGLGLTDGSTARSYVTRWRC